MSQYTNGVQVFTIPTMSPITPEPWQADAACAGMDPWIFDGIADTMLAIKTCILCPVREDCRKHFDRIERGKPQTHLDTIVAGETPGQRVERRSQAWLPRIPAPTETCRRGHPRTEENTYVDPHGWKYCRPCNRDARRRRQQRKEEEAKK